MKLNLKFCFLITTLLFFGNVHSQIIFKKQIKVPGVQAGKSILPLEDGGFFVAGRNLSTSTNLSNLFLLRLDALGDTLWTKTYTGLGEVIGERIIKTKDNNFMIVGTTYSSMYLCKITPSGEVMFTKSHTALYDDYSKPFDIIATSDGGFLITGETYSYEGYVHAKILKTDANGNALWTQGIESKGNGAAISCIETETGDYLVTGTALDGSFDPVILRYSSSGTLIETRRYKLDMSAGGGRIIKYPGVGYLIAGEKGYYPTKKGYFFAVDEQLNQVSGKAIEELLKGNDYPPEVDIDVTKDGSIVACGYTSKLVQNESHYFFRVCKFDPSFNLIWKMDIEDGPGVAESVKVLPDGSIIAVGEVLNPDQDVLIVKLEDNKCMPSEAPVISASKETVCNGDPVTLKITSGNLGGAKEWKWFMKGCEGTPIGTGDSIIVNPANAYSIAYYAKGSGGCIVSSKCGLKVIVIKPLPVIEVNKNSSVCLGRDIYLTAKGAPTILWDNGIRNNGWFSPTETKIYTATGIDENGCKNINKVKVTVLPLPKLTVTEDQTICSGDPATLYASGAPSIYWYNDIKNGVPFYPTETKTYEVMALDANNCEAHKTVTITVDVCTNVSSPQKTEPLKLYPNPAETFLNLQSEDMFDKILIYNGLGQVVLNEVFSEGNSRNIHLNIEPGYYNVFLYNESSEIGREKLIIK